MAPLMVKDDVAYSVTTKQQTPGWQTNFDFPADLKAGQTAGTLVPKTAAVTLTWSEADGPKCSCKLDQETS